jgi:hypothetical protein
LKSFNNDTIIRALHLELETTQHKNEQAAPEQAWLSLTCPTGGGVVMCRNIRVLYNIDPPTTDEEVRAAALQFVRKVSGFAKPSAANEAAFDRAVKKIADASSTLLESLVTAAPPRNRDADLARAHARAAARFGTRRRPRGA